MGLGDDTESIYDGPLADGIIMECSVILNRGVNGTAHKIFLLDGSPSPRHVGTSQDCNLTQPGLDIKLPKVCVCVCWTEVLKCT